jgi:cellulose biosynthesis protein BcsQ
MSDTIVNATATPKPIVDPPARAPRSYPGQEESLATAAHAEMDKAARLREYREHTLRLVQEVEVVFADYLDGRLTRVDDNIPESLVIEPTVKRLVFSFREVLQNLNPTNANQAFVKVEQLHLRRQIALEVAYAELCYILIQLAKSNQRTITVLTSKGGAGKTPLITNLAVLFSFVTSTSNLFLEGNENDGTANMRLGLNRAEQILLNQALSDHSLIKDRNTTDRNLGQHPQANLHALLSDANKDNNMFTMELFLYMYDVLRTQFANIFGDTGNGNESAANEGLFLESDIAILSAVADDPATFSPLLTTMTNLFKLGHVAKLQKYTRIVINGTRPGDSVADFIERFRSEAAKLVQPKFTFSGGETKPEYWTEDPDQLLRDIGFDYDEKQQRFTGKKIHLVPFSEWIRKGKPASVLPEETGLETLVAYLEILADCFKSEVQAPDEKRKEIERRLKERNETSVLSDLSNKTRVDIILQRLAGALAGLGHDSELDAVLDLETKDLIEAAAAKKVVEVLTQQGLLA